MGPNNKSVQEEGKKMNNQLELERHYKMHGYKNAGCVNYQEKAYKAMSKSKNKQYHQIGRNLHLVACHDLKVFVTIDSGD